MNRPGSRGRVVQVVRSDAFAGVERYIVDTAAMLAEFGWAVDVVGGDPARMRAELPAAVTHHRGETVAAVARSLRRIGDCEVLHAHMTAAEVPAAVLARRMGARLVVSRHFAQARSRTLPARATRPLIDRRTSARIAVSQFVADSLDAPSTVVRNGVRPTAGDCVRVRTDTVLVLQRLEPEKDTATALRAWAASGLGRRGWRLLVHGTGSQAGALRSLAGDLGIDAGVDVAGATSCPRVRLASAAIVLSTARAEPFGLTVVEAMAEATPVVATDAGAHRETLGADGAYFGVGDVAGCAAQLLRLASSPELRAELGHRLQRRQRDAFTVEAHVQRLQQVYAPQVFSA